MMKYFLSFLFIIALASCSSQNISTGVVVPVKNDFFVFDASNGFEAFYDSGATKSISEYYKSGSIVFNGSYFGGTRPGEYYPAGYWEIDKQMIRLSGILRQSLPVYNDPNITHFVGLSGSDMKIFANEEYKRNAGPYDVAFQAGPLVLSENLLQNFGDSWHANGKHQRTLLGKTKSGKVFVFISTLPLSLSEVGEKILTDERFIKDPITVLNLDGGPSTAFFDGKNAFRPNKKLPIVFRLK
ncbi:phosphodiester glycosidase family protein [Candidatus Gracilibacteria bacterium]|nr:phosphodiester glycosidase family protein [Candidatus Gracilibacteria bacterium]